MDDLKKESEFLIQKNEYEKAIFYYDEILSREPNSINILLEKANALVFLNKFDESIILFDFVLGLDPANLYAQEGKLLAIQKINLNVIQQNSAKSDENFDSIISSDDVGSISEFDESSDFLLDDSLILQKQPFLTESSITDEIIEANKFYQEKKYSESLLIYDAVLLNDPFNIHALNGKGGSQLFLNQFNESIETFEYILQFYPDDINALNGKAYVYYLKSISMELPAILYDSVHAYQDALKVDPNNIDTLVGIASALDGLERYEEAINYYDQVLFLDPDNISALNGMGYVLSEQLQFEKALHYYERSLEIDSDNIDAKSGKSFVMNRLTDP